MTAGHVPTNDFNKGIYLYVTYVCTIIKKKFVLVSLNLSYRQIENFGLIIIDPSYYFKY